LAQEGKLALEGKLAQEGKLALEGKLAREGRDFPSRPTHVRDRRERGVKEESWTWVGHLSLPRDHRYPTHSGDRRHSIRPIYRRLREGKSA
jgi:hypothetical protein